MNPLAPSSSVLIVVDVQEKLASAMPEAAMQGLVRGAGILLESARLLSVPVLASEQYPRGLGPTIAPVMDKLRDLAVDPVPKMCFDACADLVFARRLAALPARSAIVLGMEAHICVFQTVRDLVARGYDTYVVADAAVSRTEECRRIGLGLCERAGASVTVAESVAFDWLGRAGTDAFRAVSKLVR